MDALLLRSLQGYVRDTFGAAVWQAACRRAQLATETFEPMLRYDPGTADRVAQSAADVLGRPVEAIWEDMGTYLVTNPGHEGVRRLLRFGGATFADFLLSLEEMPGRARLAMPDLRFPEMTLTEPRSTPPARRSATSTCPNAVPTCASAAPSATDSSWRPATRCTRSTSTCRALPELALVALGGPGPRPGCHRPGSGNVLLNFGPCR